MAFTSDLRFIRKGDKGTLVFNVGLADERHVTKDKLYQMTVGDVGTHAMAISYVNDAGSVGNILYDRNSARDGYESIRVDVEDEEFEDRVNSLRASHAEVIHSNHLKEINNWESYCDNVIEEAKKP